MLLDWVDASEDVPQNKLVAWWHSSRTLVHPSVVEVEEAHHFAKVYTFYYRIVHLEAQLIEELVEDFHVFVRDLVVFIDGEEDADGGHVVVASVHPILGFSIIGALHSSSSRFIIIWQGVLFSLLRIVKNLYLKVVLLSIHCVLRFNVNEHFGSVPFGDTVKDSLTDFAIKSGVAI
jgi:hypothetical protein